MINNKISLLLLAAMIGTTPITFAQTDASEDQPAAENDDRERIKKHRKSKRHHMKRDNMKRIDTNQDGKVDLSEYLANAEARFNNMDRNNDGYVTVEERRETAEVMRKKHREMRKKMKEQRRAERAERDGEESEQDVE